MSTTEITFWLVGDNRRQAMAGMPFDSPGIAEEFRSDNDYKHVYAVTTTFRKEDMEKIT